MTLLADRVRTDKRMLKLLAQGDAEAKDIVEWLTNGHMPVYEVSNVAEYLRQGGHGFLELTDFPAVAPPHICYWMEWTKPMQLFDVGFERRPEKVAVLFWQEGPPEEGVWVIGAHAWAMWSNNKPEPLVSWKMTFDQAGFPEVVETHIFDGIGHLFDPARPIPPAETDIPKDLSLDEARRRYEAAQHEIERALADRAEVLHRLDAVVADWVKVAVLHPSLMAHSLLACKNVETDIHHPNPKLSKRNARKKGFPLVSFKTLRIVPTGGGGHGGQTGLTRLHIMRGHFKTFTAEKPLFGRVVGTYWWSPGLRGNAKRGVVVKDYAVEASHG